LGWFSDIGQKYWYCNVTRCIFYDNNTKIDIKLQEDVLKGRKFEQIKLDSDIHQNIS